MSKELTWSERRLVVQFRKSFARQCSLKAKPAQLAEAVVQKAQSIRQTDQIDYPDKQTRLHHLMACIVLAAEQILSDEIPSQQERLELVQNAVVEPNARTVRLFTRLMLLASRDRFDRLTRYAREATPRQYGAAFDFQTIQSDECSFIQSVNRCFYNNYFREAGQPHLTSIFCAFDKVWIEAIKPETDGVKFIRSSTLAAGADHCRFEFYRTD
ncbi:MAG: L-2-amino-thiazoline-4-carboxylic acid hydrolase [Pseudomonadota bacterium]